MNLPWSGPVPTYVLETTVKSRDICVPAEVSAGFGTVASISGLSRSSRGGWTVWYTVVHTCVLAACNFENLNLKFYCSLVTFILCENFPLYTISQKQARTFYCATGWLAGCAPCTRSQELMSAA